MVWNEYLTPKNALLNEPLVSLSQKHSASWWALYLDKEVLTNIFCLALSTTVELLALSKKPWRNMCQFKRCISNFLENEFHMDQVPFFPCPTNLATMSQPGLSSYSGEYLNRTNHDDCYSFNQPGWWQLLQSQNIVIDSCRFFQHHCSAT